MGAYDGLTDAPDDLTVISTIKKKQKRPSGKLGGRFLYADRNADCPVLQKLKFWGKYGKMIRRQKRSH